MASIAPITGLFVSPATCPPVMAVGPSLTHDDPAVGEVLRAVECQQHVPVGQHPAVAGRHVDRPLDRSVFAHDDGLVFIAHSEERVLGRGRVVGG